MTCLVRFPTPQASTTVEAAASTETTATSETGGKAGESGISGDGIVGGNGGGDGQGGMGGSGGGGLVSGAEEDDCPDLDSYVEDNLMEGDEVSTRRVRCSPQGGASFPEGGD